MQNLPKLSESLHWNQQMRKPSYSYISSIASQMGQQACKIFQAYRQFKEKQAQKILISENQFYSFSVLPFKKIATESNVCAKILNKGTKAYKCHDCIYESNSIMCFECFQKSDHRGHIYELINVFGGCCDCGDQEKWNPKGSCTKHSNNQLVQAMRKQVNPKEQKQFIHQLGFCFIYWFILYNESELILKQVRDQQADAYRSALKDAHEFGMGLLKYLNGFNKDSIISNIMTFNLLTSKIEIKQFDLFFCEKANKKSILQIILHIIKLVSCSQEADNLFMNLFTLRQFRRQLTIIFVDLHNKNPQFAMSQYNHLSCQLLTSHKMIRQLVQRRQISPLVYKPKKQNFKDFEELARHFVRYYIDIEYLTKLYKQSSEIYLNYHISQGQITSFGYYKNFSYQNDQPLQFYGIQEINMNKVVKVLNCIKNSKQTLIYLQKGIKDLFDQIMRIYKKRNSQLHNQDNYNSVFIRHIYITYELTLALLVFAYFEKIQEAQHIIYENQKISRLIKVLDLSEDIRSLQKVVEVLAIVNNNLIFSSLNMGHPETMDRFYSYYSFTFRRTLITWNSTLFLYKILIKTHAYLESVIALKPEEKMKVNYRNRIMFERPLREIEQLFETEDFMDDDQNIFDRRKLLTKLTFFLHFLIQASQTDLHELLLACAFENIKKEKYKKMLQNFYISLLKNYKKIPIKDFKKICDSFFTNEESFENFISTSKNIVIEHGKISFKEQNKIQNQKEIKIQSDLNLFYFKSYKNKLVNLNENQVKFTVPESTNHFLTQIIGEQFIDRLIKIFQAYTDIIVMEGGKIKQRESGHLGLLAIQLIKICIAFEREPDQLISGKIRAFFKYIVQKKASLQIFTEEVIKIVCTFSEEANQSSKNTTQIDNLNKEAEQKAQQRKKKLQQKKNKMLSKMKQNQEKFEMNHAEQIKRIREQLELEEQNISAKQFQSSDKCCIICRENKEKDIFKSDLMLMGFMQLSDIYELFLKKKSENQSNCHLVFKQCGHYIHKECHININKNKEYSFCQLCKSSINCLLPVSVEYFKDLDTEKVQCLALEQKIYKELKQTYSNLFSVDSGLRKDCENGFSKEIDDGTEIKLKLFDSLTKQIVYAAIVDKNSNEDFFNKKQLKIYQNILLGLRIFERGETRQIRNKSIVQQKRLGREHNIEKSKIERQTLQNKLKKIENQQTRRNCHTIYHLEAYTEFCISNYIYGETQNYAFKDQISQDLISFVDQIFKSIIATPNQTIVTQMQMKDEKQEKKVESYKKIVEQEKKLAKQYSVQTLREQVMFFSPPRQLIKLIEMRGKCPNCQQFTHKIFICLICQWKGCKECKKESVFEHTLKIHSGSSIYVDTDTGSIAYVGRKKYWIYPSIYQDYLGESFKGYENTNKLEKYALNEHRYHKIIEDILKFDIQTSIRYKQYCEKRQFTGSL